MIARGGPNIARLWPYETPTCYLLLRVSDPTSDASHRKYAGECRRRKGQCFKQERGVELNVGLQGAIGFVRLEHFERRGFYGLGKSEATQKFL